MRKLTDREKQSLANTAMALTAFAEGKQLQFRSLNTLGIPVDGKAGEWRDLLGDSTPNNVYWAEYRVKPEPRKIEVMFSKDGIPSGTWVLHGPDNSTRSYWLDRGYTFRKFVEVID